MASPPHKMAKFNPVVRATSPASGVGLKGADGAVSVTSSASSPSQAPPRKRLGLASGLNTAGVKKLTLKTKPTSTSTARNAPSADPTQWTSQATITLTRAIRAIHSRPPQPTPESLQSLYALCEGVVSRGDQVSQTLYDRVKMELERYAGEVRRDLVGKQKETSVDNDETGEGAARWGKELDEEWKGFEERVLLVRSVLLHLDRTYVLRSTGLLSLWDLALDIFRHSVIEDEAIAPRVTSTLLALINAERTGHAIPRTLLASLLSHLRALSSSTFLTLFTNPFLIASRAFFATLAASLSTTLTAVEYLKHVEARLMEEGERCDIVVAGEVKESVLKVVLEEMVTGYVERIAENDLPELMKHNQRASLTSLYSLLSRVESLDILRKSLHEQVKAAGLEIVQDEANDATMIPRLITFRSSTLAIVQDAFQGDAAFVQGVHQAFEVFINKRENKPAEMMGEYSTTAKFLDAKLRAGSKMMDDDEIEAVLKDVLYLFRFTQGKDIFEAFYKRDLAKRLLLNKSASFDAERSMLNKLKDECGPGFTAKLEIMFKDIDLASDVMRAYLSTPSYLASPPPFDLSVAILSMGNWPTYPETNVIIPPNLTKALSAWTAFYTSKHSGRSVSWRHALDTVVLKAKFKRGRKELSVSLFQAVVLLLFNEVPEGGRLGFKEIKEAVGIEEKELARTLQSLACGKVRVLQKHPKGRDVNPDDEFYFNTEFKDDHIKIKINQIQQKETAEENKSTTERVFTDRSSHLQLAIVRIMKARKTLKYSELVMETVSQIGTRFKVQTSEIKKAIDSLITLEYLQRAEGQPGVFEYLA